MRPLLGCRVQVIQSQNRSQVGIRGTVVYECPNGLDLLILTQKGIRRISRAVLSLEGSLVSTCRRNITNSKKVGKLVFTRV